MIGDTWLTTITSRSRASSSRSSHAARTRTPSAASDSPPPGTKWGSARQVRHTSARHVGHRLTVEGAVVELDPAFVDVDRHGRTPRRSPGPGQRAGDDPRASPAPRRQRRRLAATRARTAADRRGRGADHARWRRSGRGARARASGDVSLGRPMPGRRPLGRGRSYRALVLRRLLVATSVAVLAIGRRGAARRVRAARGARYAGPIPVLLVHGFQGSSVSWHALIASLRAHGYRARRSTRSTTTATRRTSTRPRRSLGRSPTLATTHRRTPDRRRQPLDGRDLVAVLPRAARAAPRTSTPGCRWPGVNEGTVWAYGCYPLDAVPGDGAVVVDAAAPQRRRSRPPRTTRYGAWWSPCDDAIVPHANAELPGARNVETACLGHSALKADPVVLAPGGPVPRPTVVGVGG